MPSEPTHQPAKPKKRPVSLPRRIFRCGLVIAGFLLLWVIVMLVAWSVPLGDFAPAGPRPVLAEVPGPILPGRQTEPHTCGWHAVGAIYRAYGVRPEDRRLRARLGVDNKSFLYDASSTGSLHPDIYRVMTQDGFSCETVKLAEPIPASLTDHLHAGHPALALIRRRQTGVMHWVVISGQGDDGLTVADSLADEPYVEPESALTDDFLLSVILIKPDTTDPPPVWKCHLRGIADMVAAFRR